MSKMIGFANATFWTDETEILYCEFNNKDATAKLEIETVKSYIDAICTICNGNPMPFLINLNEAKGTFNIAAAKFVANNKDLKKVRICESYLINTIGVKLLIGFYKRLYDPITPFKVFNDIASAKNFCLQTKFNHYESC
ncbi:hypothetical protein [Lacinutrix sp. MedPE-SW]|uniref:DUF7793 family protein n=1 Tax=Lacinutrix sp. MedPE-SW TaxID=1860087 RepID=UPI00090EBEB3|nr:hypothetical protein [Lacinutrix sp. MedPE-SW]OIQ22404.1 MAG: hypothetical protein BM549_07265 [Lacinutrix sp. MedPE-SW]